MVTVSLDAMAAGGIYDQVGGGFHRYSVDAYWLVPHFEKMLYDQALLLRAYLHGWLVTGEPPLPARRRGDRRLRAARPAPPRRRLLLRRGRRLRGRRGQVLLLVARGARERLRRRRRRRDRATSASPSSGNFEDPHTGFRGNILHVVDRTEDRARPRSERAGPRCSPAREPGAARARRQGAARLERAVPRALAEAAAAFDARRLDGRGAHRTRGSCSTELRRDDGRLLRSWQDGRAHLLAYAEDYAALLEALAHAGRARRRAVARDRRVRSPATWSSALRRRRAAAASSPPAPTPRRSSCGPRTSRTTRRRRRTRSPPTGCCGSPRSPATTTPRTRATAWIGRLAPVLGEHPTAFASCCGAVDRCVHPPLEVAIVGDDGPGRAALVAELRGRLLPAVGARDRAAGHRRRAHAAARRPRPRRRRGPPRTCASTSRAACRSPTPTRSAPSSTRALPVRRRTGPGASCGEWRGRRRGPRPSPSRTRSPPRRWRGRPRRPARRRPCRPPSPCGRRAPARARRGPSSRNARSS